MQRLFPILILSLALAACTPAAPAPAVPAEQPAPATQAPVDTNQPAPATPETTPASQPMPEPAFHLSDYTLSAQVLTSPDGVWTVEALRGEIRPSSMTGEDKDVNRITAENAAAGLRWEYVERPNHGLGEGVPAGFTFTTDSTRLYFYDAITPDGGCGQVFTARLRYMELATGRVETAAGFDREAYFSLDPTASRAAEIAGAAVEVTDLASGEKKSIPFIKPMDDETGTPPMFWSADGNWLAFDLRTNALRCDARPELIDTVVVDIEQGEANNLGMWAEFLGAMGWDGPGLLRVQTGRDTPATMNVKTGQSQPAAVDREAMSRQQAEWALRGYLGDLYLGREDPQRAAQAANLFAGDWGALTSLYPNMRFTDNAAMLNYACSRGDILCYPVRQVQFVKIDPNGSYVFDVQFLTPEGDILNISNMEWFRFTLAMDWPDLVQIFQLPPQGNSPGKP